MSFQLATPTTRAEKETFPFIKPRAYSQDAITQTNNIALQFGENTLNLSANTQHESSFTGIIPAGENQLLVEIITGAENAALHDSAAFSLGENSTLTHLRLHLGDADYTAVRHTDATLAAGATFNQFTVNAAAKNSPNLAVRTTAMLNLMGEGAHVNVQGINLLRGTQKADSWTEMHFKAPNCTANVEQRQIVDDSAHVSFQGKFHVHQIAQKTDAYMMSKSLLLGDKARTSQKPELEIYADDVKCSHGTTTGELDAEALNYLMARGIPLKQARAMLVTAFAQDLAEKIEHDAIRQQVQDLIADWLQS